MLLLLPLPLLRPVGLSVGLPAVRIAVEPLVVKRLVVALLVVERLDVRLVVELRPWLHLVLPGRDLRLAWFRLP